MSRFKSFRLTVCTRLVFLLAVLAISASPITAQAQYTVQATGSATTGGPSSSFNTGVLVNSGPAGPLSVTSTNIDPISSALRAESTASASAAPGSLKASVKSESFSSSFGGASANATAGFSDRLFLSSTSLGASAPVDLLFTWAVSGAFSGCNSCPAQAFVSSALTVVSETGVGSYLNGISSVTYGRSFSGGLGNLTAAPTLVDIRLTTTLADIISPRGNLSVFSGVDGLGSFAEADFFNTANLFVTVLTPDVTFSSESGASYSTTTPIPEPEIYAMLGVGLGLLGWVGRRKRLQAA